MREQRPPLPAAGAACVTGPAQRRSAPGPWLRGPGMRWPSRARLFVVKKPKKTKKPKKPKKINYTRAKTSLTDKRVSHVAGERHESRLTTGRNAATLLNLLLLRPWREEPSCCTRLLPQSRFWPFAKSVV